jgi:RND family efflux transporter MFP subunit
VALVLLLAAGVWAYRMNRIAMSRAEALRPRPATGPSTQRVVAEARLVARPGAQVTVRCESGGRLDRILVVEGAAVRQSDLIAELNSEEHQAALDEERGRLTEVESELNLAESRVNRVAKLVSTKAASEEELEQRRHEAKAAGARRDISLAKIRRLNELLRKTQIRSPIDGTVVARFAHQGETKDAGDAIVTVADLGQTRLEAEVNEFDTDRVRVGVGAKVIAEGYPDKQWRAEVEEVPEAVTTRQLKPQDAGRPSDTGVLLVKLRLLEPVPFKLGQRVEVFIESTTSAPIAGVGD